VGEAFSREHAMSVKSHLPHRTARPEQPQPAAPPPATPTSREERLVYQVQRTGAIGVGGFLLVFGLLGLAGGLRFFSTHGEQVLGMSSNGLLSVLSVVVGLLLIGSALLGPRTASTVMMVFGVLFLLSALGNLAVLRTGLNVLAFEISNVLFSIAVGLLLLVLGAYGRVSGNLPADSPYAHRHPDDEEQPESYPSTPAELAAEAAMREAEIAVSNHVGTDDQRRRVQAMAAVHTRADRRRVWMEFDARQPAPPTEVPHPRRPVVARAVDRARDRMRAGGHSSAK
jgi:Domain of unknown function (DUF4383)